MLDRLPSAMTTWSSSNVDYFSLLGSRCEEVSVAPAGDKEERLYIMHGGPDGLELNFNVLRYGPRSFALGAILRVGIGSLFQCHPLWMIPSINQASSALTLWWTVVTQSACLQWQRALELIT
jgi:hypothetical protein